MNMQEFLTKLANDKALVEKINKSATPDEAYAIAKEAGLTDSYENFVDTAKKLSEAAGEMSGEDMDKITGGSDTSVVVIQVTLDVSIVSCTGAIATALSM